MKARSLLLVKLRGGVLPKQTKHHISSDNVPFLWTWSQNYALYLHISGIMGENRIFDLRSPNSAQDNVLLHKAEVLV